VEYTKINIIAFQNEETVWRILQRPSIAIGSNVSRDKAALLVRLLLQL
jgi:hypothetical protein